MTFNPQIARLAYIPNGTAGVKTTLKLMCAIVKLYRATPLIRQWAGDVCRGVPNKFWRGEMEALYSWVQQNIRYFQDPRNVEWLQMPDKTLELGFGDCDDQSILLSAGLEAAGYATKFVACGPDHQNFEHVFVQAQIPDTDHWLSMDTTEPYGLGWAPQLPAYLSYHVDRGNPC
jgi:transglutaminase-like putative cysteine protease